MVKLVKKCRVNTVITCFLYICIVKALVIKTKNNSEFKFVSDLLKKLGIGVSNLTAEEIEDLGMSKLLHKAEKTKKASRAEIMKKLST
jgi:hypothetical protein